MSRSHIQTMTFLLLGWGMFFGGLIVTTSADPDNPQPVGIFEDHADFGDWTMEGDAAYDAQTGEYILRGTGNPAEDYGHVAYCMINGDFRIKAKVSSDGPRAAYIGCLQSLEDLQDTWYLAWVESTGALEAFWRTSYGISWQISPMISNVFQDGLMEVVRKGNVFSLYYIDRDSGEPVEIDSRTIEITDPIYVCLGSWSGNFSQYNVAHFSEVQLVVESIKQVIESQINDVNLHNTDAFIGNFAEDAVYEFVPLLTSYSGREEIAAFYNGLFSGFPDFHYSLNRLVTSGNIIVTEGMVTGTHLNEWVGIPATGKNFQVIVFHIWEFEGNTIKKATEYVDLQTPFVQLGLVELPEIPELVPNPA